MISSSTAILIKPRRTDATILSNASQSDRYTDACDYITEKYRTCYGADIQCDYKNLLVAQDATGRHLAAAGYRTPDEKFYLEHYLTLSAQHTLTEQLQIPVARNQIIEIGNLVSSDSRITFSLMQQLWNHLASLQYQYVMLTCTRQLKRRFRRLPYLTIASASPDNVPGTHHWGRYYNQDPVVIAGNLSHYDQRFSKFSVPLDITISLVTKPEPTQ